MKGNFGILSPEQIKDFKDKYEIEVSGKYVIVINKGYSRLTAFYKDKNFSLILKKGNKTITFKIVPKTIDLWIKTYYNYSVLDVQNAINILQTLCQEVNEESIWSQLKRFSYKIKEI